MIVPDHWAEARATAHVNGRVVTLRRFGWSETSAADAQTQAELRAAEAARLAASGQDVPRRELKLTYNGAQGLPIREEVLARHGEAVVTRNAYGARCLNVPDLLIADVDVDESPSRRASYIALLAAAVMAAPLIALSHDLPGKLLDFAVLFLGPMLLKRPVQRLLSRGVTAAERARQAIARFIAEHDGWRLRVYQTPAGLRLIATHARFAPTSEQAREFFAAVGVDPVYARMCLNQHCFRARLTAKPWRIGIAGHMKPRPGVWPINPERLPDRRAWVARYEREAEAYAACRYVETLGSGTDDPALMALVALHDTESRALDDVRQLA